MKSKYVIDDLLTTLAPELVAAYERNVLGGQSLRALNEELKGLPDCGTWPKMFIYLIVQILSVLCGLWAVVHFELMHPLFCTAAIFVGPVFIAVLHHIFIGRRELKNERRRLEIENILQEFSEAALRLRDPGSMLLHAVTTQTAIDSIIGRAAAVIQAEYEFDQLCDQHPRKVKKIMCVGRVADDRRAEMCSAVEQAAKFGVLIKKADAFSSGLAKVARLGS